MHLTHERADAVGPGIWLSIVVVPGSFARPMLDPGAVISTVVLGIHNAAREGSDHE
jgi:hypothetical protein